MYVPLLENCYSNGGNAQLDFLHDNNTVDKNIIEYHTESHVVYY